MSTVLLYKVFLLLPQSKVETSGSIHMKWIIWAVHRKRIMMVSRTLGAWVFSNPETVKEAFLCVNCRILPEVLGVRQGWPCYTRALPKSYIPSPSENVVARPKILGDMKLANLGQKATDRNTLSQTAKCSAGQMSGIIKALILLYKFTMELLCIVLLNNYSSVC